MHDEKQSPDEVRCPRCGGPTSPTPGAWCVPCVEHAAREERPNEAIHASGEPVDWTAKALMARDLIRSADSEDQELRIIEKCLRWANEWQRPDYPTNGAQLAYEAILKLRDACTTENSLDYVTGLEDASEVALKIASSLKRSDGQ